MRWKRLQGVLLFILVFQANTVLAEQDFSLKNNPNFGFYLQGDSVFFEGDKEDTVAHKQNLKSCVNIPRARFYVNGDYYETYYSLEYDAAEKAIREAFLRDQKYKNFWLTIGQFKAPYNFWFITSQSKSNFLEQGLATNAFNLSFRTGIFAQIFADPFTLSLAVLGPEANNMILDNQLHGHVPLAANGRITFVPVHNENEVIHFAVAGVLQDTDSRNQFRFRTIPEVHSVNNNELVDTGFIPNCRNYKGLEFESVFIMNSLTLTTEYFKNHVNRYTTNLAFQGSSFIFDYFLTGEHYVYNFHLGDVDGISKIRHCYGAWQVLARYSAINLNDEDIHGGEEGDVTVGLNVWLNQHVRFLADYIRADTHPSDNRLDRHVNIFALRLQINS